MLWELIPALITIVISAAGFWWLFKTPNTNFQKTVVALACIVTLCIDPRKAFNHEYPPAYDTLLDFRLHDLRALHIRMVLTLGAVVWLVLRAISWSPRTRLTNMHSIYAGCSTGHGRLCGNLFPISSTSSALMFRSPRMFR